MEVHCLFMYNHDKVEIGTLKNVESAFVAALPGDLLHWRALPTADVSVATEYAAGSNSSFPSNIDVHIRVELYPGSDESFTPELDSLVAATDSLRQMYTGMFGPEPPMVGVQIKPMAPARH